MRLRLKKEYVPGLLKIVKEKFSQVAEADFKTQRLETLTRQIAEELTIKTNQVFHPIRVSVSGRTVGPGLFEMLEVLGKEKVLKRIEKVLKEKPEDLTVGQDLE